MGREEQRAATALVGGLHVFKAVPLIDERERLRLGSRADVIIVRQRHREAGEGPPRLPIGRGATEQQGEIVRHGADHGRMASQIAPRHPARETLNEPARHIAAQREASWYVQLR